MRLFFLICLVHFSYAHAKIIDCFLFFNELEILKIRLEELYDHVDYFVLVESCETFKGQAKPYYFEENKELFQKYLAKIVHVKVEDRILASHWERDHFQRNCILRGLWHLALPEDIILISDVDEIPRNTVIPFIQNMFDVQKKAALVLEQNYHPFCFNRYSNKWQGTVAVKGRYLRKKSPQVVRDDRGGYAVIHNGGWHFSFMGGINKIRVKIQSYAHTENEVFDPWNTPPNASFDTLLGIFPVVEIDDTFPKYICENIEYYKSIGYID